MTKYASFDHNVSAPSPVIGWYDTDIFTYPNLPGEDDLLILTQDEWDNRLDGLWAVDNGALVVVEPPGPSLPQQAAAMLAEKIALGVGIASVSEPAVNATYALDQVSTAQIFQIGLYAMQFDMFPNGDTTQMYPDILGDPHAFSIPVFVAFLQAIAPIVSDLNTQAGIMAQGGTPVWPTQAATII